MSIAGSLSADATPTQRSAASQRLTLSSRGPTSSCPVSVPNTSHNSAGSKAMFVKSASATQLSLLIPPPQGEFHNGAALRYGRMLDPFAIYKENYC